MLAAVHSMFELTLTVRVFPPPPLAGIALSGVSVPSVRFAVEASCVTVSVRVIPPPDTVTTALRVPVVAFALAVNVNVPALLPDAGVTVSHGWLLTAVHSIFDDTDTVRVLPPPPLAGIAVSGVSVPSVRFAVEASCVIVTVRVIPPPDTVTTALRVPVVAFALAVNVNVLLLLPDEGVTVSHA